MTKPDVAYNGLADVYDWLVPEARLTTSSPPAGHLAGTINTLSSQARS